jgi:hypothetical protein
MGYWVEHDKALFPVLHDVVLRYIAICACFYDIVDACHTVLNTVEASLGGFGLGGGDTFLCGGARSHQGNNACEQERFHDASPKCRDA